MSETIDIKITDKVDAGIVTKLKNISSSARDADTHVRDLQKALNALKSSGIDMIAKQTQNATKALQAGAIASQRLATEQARTEAAIARTAAAKDRAAIAAMRLQQAQERAARSSNDMTNQAESLKRSLDPLYDAQARYNAAMERASSLHKAGAIDLNVYNSAVTRATSDLDAAKKGAEALNNGMVKAGSGTKLAAHHITNLGYQLNDIGVSLASGQSPLMVLIQQGSQIGQIAGQAGVGLWGLTKAAAGMLVPFLPLVAAIGAGYAALKLFQSEAEKNAGLKEFTNTLGLTKEEMKDLKDVSITTGDVFKGLWRTFSDATGAGDAFDQLWMKAKSAFSAILETGAMAAQGLYALFKTGGAMIQEIWNRLPVSFKGPFVGMLNESIKFFEGFVNIFIGGINQIISAMNRIPGVAIQAFDSVSFGKISMQFAEASGKTMENVALDTFNAEFKAAQNWTKGQLDTWQQNTIKAAKDRLKGQAKEIIDGRSSKSGKGAGDKAESRELSLANVNLQLDNELSRMKLISDELSKQQKLDSITEQLARKRITMTLEERDAIVAKIEAITNAAQVQSAMNDIYNSFAGPQKTYNSGLAAASELLKQGKITNEQYAQSVRKTEEAYANAQNPLREYLTGLDQQIALSRLSAKEMSIESEVMSLRNQLLKEGKVLTDEEANSIRSKLALLKEQNAIQQMQNSMYENSAAGQKEKFGQQMGAIGGLKGMPGSTGADVSRESMNILSGMGIDTSMMQGQLEAQAAQFQTYYDQLRMMREQDLLSESEYSSAKLQLANKENQIKISGLNSFLDQTAALQNSSVKEIAIIGKAAAIAQATIQAYTAANSAYAAMAAIPYVGPALGAAAAAAAIAAGMANVAQIRSAGYRSGGYTGNAGLNEVAGVVHGQEFVMNAGATSRIGVQDLQALQSGAASVQRNSESATSPTPAAMFAGNTTTEVKPEMNVRVINNVDPALMGDYLASPDGEQTFVNTIRRNSDTIRALMQ
jgi:hypothetical protein